MGVVVQGMFDTFHPSKFDVPPDDAVSMHADYVMATAVISWAQSVRQVTTRRVLEPQERKLLLDAAGAVFGHPEP